MKYYTICFPGEYDQNVVETWSEDQIIQSYYKYWSTKMLENVKNPDLSKEKCIDDWCVCHWAVETDKWGNKLTTEHQWVDLTDDEIHAAIDEPTEDLEVMMWRANYCRAVIAAFKEKNK